MVSLMSSSMSTPCGTEVHQIDTSRYEVVLSCPEQGPGTSYTLSVTTVHWIHLESVQTVNNFGLCS